ncbi:unnamed protein product [Diatraea saccharalis]|uniref:Uncharacterized protein n=1 Tax=Diatraea saccharalis TaxID=40085 RepID=A0A9N9WC45_9NEOP|nr:unnamed protein product [Diatraea saccharalis]
MTNAVVKLSGFGSARLQIFFFILLTCPYYSFARRSSGSYGRSSHSSHGGGGTHTYPASTGYSGTGSGGSHLYPSSTGLSGNSNYNSHVTKQTTTRQHDGSYHGRKTEVHHHSHQNYHYSPPPRVNYGSVSYPVYHAQPPVYVYQYRDSGSRFDNLLTGLALYNLGRMSANHDHYHHYDPDRRYVSAPGEMCKLGIRRKNGDYEETRVDCELMSSFIWDTDPSTTRHNTVPKNTVSTTVTNMTKVQSGEPNSNNSITTITVTNTTVVDALQAKGQSIEVTQDMTCYMIRISRTSNMKKEIKCGILQAYAQSSWRPNACEGISSKLPVALLLIYEWSLFQIF